MLGFRTRNEHGWSNDQIHAPELLVSGDVLGGHAPFAFGQGLVVAALLVGREFALGMSMEISAVAFQGEHEKQFGIHARRGNICSGEAGYGGGESVAEDHGFHLNTGSLQDARLCPRTVRSSGAFSHGAALRCHAGEGARATRAPITPRWWLRSSTFLIDSE